MSVNQQNVAENDFVEVGKTWDKFASSAKKAGYRDGIIDGRNQVFQKSFDEGYTEGFKNGFAIGKYKGVLCSHPDKNIVDINLHNSRKGWCQICLNEDLIHSPINEIKNKQIEFSNNLLRDLYSKYTVNTKVKLHKDLEH